jgi:hypothetical protein
LEPHSGALGAAENISAIGAGKKIFYRLRLRRLAVAKRGNDSVKHFSVRQFVAVDCNSQIVASFVERAGG